ncbi:MAG: DUF5683 domain-containing protein [Candidatus Zixiibacteriota bacterium]
MLPRRNEDIIRTMALFVLIILIMLSPACAATTDIIPADSLNPIDSSLASPASNDDGLLLSPVLYQASEDSFIVRAYLTENTLSIPKRSQSMTMLKSVAFPGWGQFANKKYFKSGVIFLVESYFIYKAVDYGIKAGDARKYWRGLPDSLASQKAEAFRAYANYRDTRNTNIWYAGITIFFSMIDAYVDAHLQDFPPPIKKSDNISIELSPGEKSAFAIVYKF